MTDFDTLKSRMLHLLSDSGSTRFEEKLLAEALRQALGEYSRACPQVAQAELTVAEAGRTQALAALPDLEAVLQVVYPYRAGDARPRRVQDYWYYWHDGVPTLYLGSGPEPQAGAVMQVTYSRGHTLQGLDGAAVTSVPANHLTTVVSGAAGHAASLRSAGLMEAYGRRTAEVVNLAQWSKEMLNNFRSTLRLLRSTAPALPGALPVAGWARGRIGG